MTSFEFTMACEARLTGVIKVAASHALNTSREDQFIEELLEQDSDEGSRSGTKRILGEELYNELQKFK